MAKNLKVSDILTDAVATTIGGDIANGATFTVAYPAGAKAADYSNGPGNHAVYALGAKYDVDSGKVSLSFGASVVTVTWNAGLTLPAGTKVHVELNRYGSTLPDNVDDAPDGSVALGTFLHRFGAVAASDDDALFTAQLLGAAGNFTLIAGGKTFDVPRNVIFTVATTDHSARTLTITGTDAFGNVMVETIAGPNNNVVAGKKAFKTITSIASDGAIATNGIKAGFGEVLGLPFFVPNKGMLLKANVDGADELAASTVVGGLATGNSTATSADVRGTIDFNTAANGTRILEVVALGGANNLGVPQYAG